MSDHWMQTYTGKIFDYEDLDEKNIDINDIIASLAKTCRFNGHITKFFSVLQHSLLVLEIYMQNLPTEDIDIIKRNSLQLLLHDAAEAYISDIPRPFKHFLSETKLKEAEISILSLIFKKYGVPLEEGDKEIIKIYDNSALMTEKALLFATGTEWTVSTKFYTLDEIPIYIMDYKEANNLYKKVFNLLCPDNEKIELNTKNATIVASSK